MSLEYASCLCVEDDGLLPRVSTQTAAATLQANEKPMVEFRYAEDGHLVTGINTLLSLRPDDRFGSDPHRFDSRLRDLGADPDHNTSPEPTPPLLPANRNPRRQHRPRRPDHRTRPQLPTPPADSSGARRRPTPRISRHWPFPPAASSPVSRLRAPASALAPVRGPRRPCGG
ncbi:hypothetical protein [Actinomadura sp. NPDC000929]|uniref:DUF6461 domain-containing protein n=1 Tax=Actinomadura sp. NPDC000929 TaxID=3154517 RepID=UPI003391942D